MGGWNTYRLLVGKRKRKYPRFVLAGYMRPQISTSDRGGNCCSDIFNVFLSALLIL
jgi:hypothetical protein